MKKIIALLAIVSVFGFVACGDATTGEGEGAKADSTATDE